MRIKSLLKQSVVASSLLVVAPVMVSANDFTGLYAGVHVVHSTGTQDYRYAFSALDRWRFTGTFAEYDLSGQGAGLQLGYGGSWATLHGGSGSSGRQQNMTLPVSNRLRTKSWQSCS